MFFHEDVIFKNDAEEFGQDFVDLVEIEGEVVKFHKTEYSVVDPKMFKPDHVIEFLDKISIFEFQSTKIKWNEKRRFRFYTALVDMVRKKSKKPIEVHVLSTVEDSQTIWYDVSPETKFPIYVHSLKKYDGDEFLNNMKIKIKNEEEFTKKELLMISLLCFMKTEKSLDEIIYESAVTITNIPGLNYRLGQFVKGTVLMLSDKFIKDELLKTSIANMVAGNMKIVEDYAQRIAQEKVDEAKGNVVINLGKKGLPFKEIAELAEVSLDFVKQTLSK